MEVIEIISQYINKDNNIINVEFLCEDDEYARQDTIEYSYFEDFGYETLNDTDIFYDDDDDWDDFGEDIVIDDDTLISFLNEYYFTFPERFPEEQYS